MLTYLLFEMFFISTNRLVLQILTKINNIISFDKDKWLSVVIVYICREDNANYKIRTPIVEQLCC